MTAMSSPFLTPTAQTVLQTLAAHAGPLTVADVQARVNPQPVTSREVEIERWRERDRLIVSTVEELTASQLVAVEVQKRGSRVASVLRLAR